MKLTVIGLALSLVTGISVALWIVSGETQPSSLPQSAVGFDHDAPVEERIRALEQAVSDERLARQLLQEEVLYLTMELERMADPVLPRSNGEAQVATAESEGSNPRESRREQSRRRNSREGRIESLVKAGFLPSQAEMILRREEELQMASIQARFDAERSGEPVDWMANRTLTSDTLREELGDTDYERYLEANNRSTRIAVSSVIESSPAQTAGLQPGDEIVRYDGERVFSMTDLTRQTMVGAAGETVIVDVMRNGNIMQVVMPRGPVGITGGRRRF
jgi:membrane-associated protease RseP (regulator of RpoE activity)